MEITIKIKIQGKEQEFSMEEAQELFAALSGVFGAKENIFAPVSIPYSAPFWAIPPYKQPPPHEVTCAPPSSNITWYNAGKP